MTAVVTLLALNLSSSMYLKNCNFSSNVALLPFPFYTARELHCIDVTLSLFLLKNCVEVITRRATSCSFAKDMSLCDSICIEACSSLLQNESMLCLVEDCKLLKIDSDSTYSSYTCRHDRVLICRATVYCNGVIICWLQEASWSCDSFSPCFIRCVSLLEVMYDLHV